MSDSIPEYYRHLAQKEDQSDSARPAPPSNKVPEFARPRKEKAAPPPASAPTYVGNDFTLDLPADWNDRTIHTFAGIVADGIQHVVTVMADPDTAATSLVEYVDLQISSLEESLNGCRILLREPSQLRNGMPAYRAIFSWHPVEARRLYQEQLYVLQDGVGYKLTATFSRKTRKTLGPQVERMMLSFEPRRREG